MLENSWRDLRSGDGRISMAAQKSAQGGHLSGLDALLARLEAQLCRRVPELHRQVDLAGLHHRHQRLAVAGVADGLGQRRRVARRAAFVFGALFVAPRIGAASFAAATIFGTKVSVISWTEVNA